MVDCRVSKSKLDDLDNFKDEVLIAFFGSYSLLRKALSSFGFEFEEV